MPIEIAEYDPKWVEMFRTERRRLRAALGELALRIEHVGSTAVPRLAAKPVIDIQVSVASLDDSHQGALESIGYNLTPIPLAFFHRPAEWPHTHHVHVREADGADERRTLAFRDWLREHPVDRRAYEKLKRSLARHADPTSPVDRARYSESKTEFIREVERRSQTPG